MKRRINFTILKNIFSGFKVKIREYFDTPLNNNYYLWNAKAYASLNTTSVPVPGKGVNPPLYGCT